MATRAPLTQAELEYLRTRKQAGETLQRIAEELHCSYGTARKWWRRERRQQTRPVRGRPRRGVLSTYPASLIEAAVAIKRAHPHWGPANVTVELQQQSRWAQTHLPSRARLAALFKAVCPEVVQPHRPRTYPEQPLPKAQTPHQRWQIDGKEKVALGDHDVATVLNIRDPASAVMIGSQAIVTTTAHGWRKVTLTEVQETLRTAFTEWGLPLELQTDHEVVYTGAPDADFPSHFTLWVVGLGMHHRPSRDRRPTDQAQVERNHRTLGDMTWQDEAFDQVDQLQARLTERRQRYNYALPVRAANCQGQPPLQAHPQAQHSGRPFARAHEWTLFDLDRVDAYLAARVWTRQISASGGVSIGHHLYYVGREYLKQSVAVRFIPETRTFRFELPNGTQVAELPAIGLNQEDLIGYLPVEAVCPTPWQIPLPLVGV